MTDFSRRDFFKIAGSTVLGAAAYSIAGGFRPALVQAPVIGSTQITAGANSIGSKAKVYFTKQND
ncbi:hypothetical protein [Megamonas hypermegale]|uniref:hypothetical protein n=1 Tax=Megamonas hypermegale TaxID=158847 RepID=UPI0025A3DF72|nr:hypothetical protein [Megamonas hypermegale]MDM8143945.1 hypothetical protein [Megamonas hypermegale]